MIKIENCEVVGWKPAIRGMRNPKNSWDRSDSMRCLDHPNCDGCPANNGEGCGVWGLNPYVIGPNDHKLMMQLSNGGPVHAKYRRFIDVYLDITAPLYWWKEFDTYRVGVVPNPDDIEMNSCSTMHKIHEKEFTFEDFSCEHLIINEHVDIETLALSTDCTSISPIEVLSVTIEVLNAYREKFLKTNDKKYWHQMIQLLPTSYNQKRTLKMTYEVLANIYKWRKDHKLDEWRELCKWIESLPYSEIVTGENDEKENNHD